MLTQETQEVLITTEAAVIMETIAMTTIIIKRTRQILLKNKMLEKEKCLEISRHFLFRYVLFLLQ